MTSHEYAKTSNRMQITSIENCTFILQHQQSTEHERRDTRAAAATWAALFAQVLAILVALLWAASAAFSVININDTICIPVGNHGSIV
jgi:hypothetical protein